VAEAVGGAGRCEVAVGGVAAASGGGLAPNGGGGAKGRDYCSSGCRRRRGNSDGLKCRRLGWRGAMGNRWWINSKAERQDDTASATGSWGGETGHRLPEEEKK
jgi:hypothetical protein